MSDPYAKIQLLNERKTMRKNNPFMDILECKECSGQGYYAWASPDGDYDFEWCVCNPHKLDLTGFKRKVNN